jgi:hypothetical protein
MRFLYVGVLVAAAACSQERVPTSVEDESSRQQAVTATLDGQAVVLRNGADFPVRVAVLDSVYVTNLLALWCFGSDECGTQLVANGTLRIPLGEVEGFSASTEELLVHWWNPADPERQAGEGAPVRKFSVHVGG